MFEDLSAKVDGLQDSAMNFEKPKEQNPEPKEGAPMGLSSSPDDVESAEQAVPAVNSAQTEAQENESELDKLYPIFWSLQESFSMPTRLFDTKNFQAFKEGLSLAIAKFQSVHQELQARGTSKILEDSKRITKRKRSSHDDEISNSINPRYLTSRDLFDLEVCK